MNERIQYFSRCNGDVVQLRRVQYAARAVQLPFLAYAGQTQFVREGRTLTICDLASVLPSRFTLFAIGECEGCKQTHAAERIIDRGKTPKGHLCDARCRYALGKDCECSCGGRWHGVGETHPGQALLFGAGGAA